MDIFGASEETMQKERRDCEMFHSFTAGDIKFKAVKFANNFSRETMILLVKIKELFQIQLPKMPRDYILKQVFDLKHRSMCMFRGDNLVGAICYRPFFEYSFTEVVFLAVDSSSQIKGNGGFMMSMFKEFIKSQFRGYQGAEGNMYFNDETQEIFEISEENIKYEIINNPLYFITYADNSALGFFKKQGFRRRIKFDKWVNVIKDYEGGTLVECRIIWGVNYLSFTQVANDVKNAVFSKVQNVKRFGPVQNGTTEHMISNPNRNVKSEEAVLDNFFTYIIADISSNASSWPFLSPVNPTEVPDYYHIILNPIDISNIQSRVNMSYYKSIKMFEEDFALMFSNCYTYNAATTQYYKCGQNLESYFRKKVDHYKKKQLLLKCV